MRERRVIDALREAFPDWGIGDDAAFLKTNGKELCISCDAVAEGVHFNLEYSTLRQVIEKLVTANVSDVNAVGGKPLGFLLSAGLPHGFDEEQLNEIIEGLRTAASFYSIKLLGGDTVFNPGGYFFDLSIYGELDPGEALLRSGAKAGDRIVLFGECGASLAGLKLLEFLHLDNLHTFFSFSPQPTPQVNDLLREMGGEILERMRRLSLEDYRSRDRSHEEGTLDIEVALSFIRRHLVPVASPIPEEFLREYRRHIHAAVDISDGLAIDLGRLAESSGVGAIVNLDSIPVPFGMEFLFQGGKDVLLDAVVSSGEEYCIAAAVSPVIERSLPEGAAVIGEFTKGEGVKFIDHSGKEKRLDISGFEHTF